MADFKPTLDLTGSDPDTIGFPPLPSGPYECIITDKTEWRTTENIDGSKALPHDTPYLAVALQVKEDEEPRDGQRVANAYLWTNLFMPPADYDVNKAQGMKNRWANFLKAIGEDIDKKSVNIPEVDDMIGREVTVVNRKQKNKMTGEWENNVQGFKPAGSSATMDDEPAGLLR